MGPAPANNVPTRPKFSWDAKSAPWTDGKGDQEEYQKSVKLWEAFHNALPDNNSNKIPSNLRAICLKSQLYGRAKDLCSGIADESLLDADGVQKIVHCIYQRDALSVVSEAFKSFNHLWNTRRGSTETMKNFESRFSAHVAKFNSISTTTKLPECITALMLLANSAIDDNQRISVMAATAPSDATFTAQSTNDEFLAAITYNSVASVIKQCDKTSQNTEESSALTASTAGTSSFGSNQNRGNYNKPRLSKAEYDALKMKHPCNKCGKYGHWIRDHNSDGSLPSHVKSVESGNNSSTNGNNAVSFNMASLVGSAASTTVNVPSETGPLVDDGAPYSAIGMTELLSLSNKLDINIPIKLESIPSSLNGHTHWQYGTGAHSSSVRRILGSIVLTACSDTGRDVKITHLVLEGSSQWVIGRNVTRNANLEHLGRNAISFFVENVPESISLIDHEFLSYIPMSTFLKSIDVTTLTCHNGNTLMNKKWSEVVKIIDKVHKHVCGHATYTDFQLLLERNNLWNETVASYVAQTIQNCSSCKSSALPQPNRKVSISTLSKQFNEIVCIDHFFLDEICLVHCMDLVSRFSAVQAVESTNLADAVVAFEACWVSQFWYPESLHGDKAFQIGEFKLYAESLDIPIRPVPPRRHSKNSIESKHNVIRSIYIRLKEAAKDNHNAKLAAYKAVSISNDLYGNDTLSAFELAKGFTKPIMNEPIDNLIPDDIIESHEKLQARRKLVLILKSNAIQELPIHIGDLVEVYVKKDHEKRGSWSTPKPVLSVNHEARSVTVPGKDQRVKTVSIEDLRPATPELGLAKTVQEGIDLLDDMLLDLTNATPTYEENMPGGNSVADSNDDEFSSDDQTFVPAVGSNISVFWPLDKQFYSGVVASEEDDGKLNIHYDDGDKECLNMDEEQWKFTNTITANSSQATSSLQVQCTEGEVLSSMLSHFGNKSFLKHQAQGFEQFPLINSYKHEEENFLKTVQLVPITQIPSHANVINSHTLYKLKQDDDGNLKLKARIAPHGNEDDLKDKLSKDCATCPPTGLRIVESIASLHAWTLYKADVKAAFLQTGSADRDVYVRPPRESHLKTTHVWLLLTAAYGLVNANAKWQNKSDDVMFQLGLTQSKFIPQLFYKKEGGKLVLIVAKIVDDLKAAGVGNNAKNFLENFHKVFNLGTINHGPGRLRFFGINTVQSKDFTVTTDADDKMEAVSEYPLTRQRRKEPEMKLNDMERSEFASVNSSLGWIGTAASPLCSFYSSYLQQKAPHTTVSNLTEQISIVRKLKKYGTSISYPRPTDKTKYKLSILVFSDASRVDENGQIGLLAGLLVGEMEKQSICHALSWISHKSKRPVKSVPAAEILAATEGIDEGKMIAQAYSELMAMEIKMQLCVDSKDLFTSLSTQRNSIDRSIRGDVSSIRFEFQTGAVEKISRVPGNVNLADPLTKKDSQLSDLLQLTLYKGRLCVDLDASSETKHSQKNFG